MYIDFSPIGSGKTERAIDYFKDKPVTYVCNSYAKCDELANKHNLHVFKGKTQMNHSSERLCWRLNGLDDDEINELYCNPLFSTSMCKLCGDMSCYYHQQRKEGFLLTIKDNIEQLQQPYVLDDVPLSSVVVYDHTFNTFYLPDEDEAKKELQMNQEMLKVALKEDYDGVQSLSRRTYDLSVKIDYYKHLLRAYAQGGLMQEVNGKVRIAYIKEDVFDNCIGYISATPSSYDHELLKMKDIDVKREPMKLTDNVRVLQLSNRENTKKQLTTKKLNMNEYTILLDIIEVAILTNSKVLIFCPKFIKEELSVSLDRINYLKHCDFDHFYSATSVGINPLIRYYISIIIGTIGYNASYYEKQYDVLSLDPRKQEIASFDIDKYLELRETDVSNHITQVIGRLRPFESEYIDTNIEKHIVLLTNIELPFETERLEESKLKKEIKFLRQMVMSAYIKSFFDENKDITEINPSEIAKEMNKSLQLRSDDFIRWSIISYCKRQGYKEHTEIRNGHKVTIFTRPCED